MDSFRRRIPFKAAENKDDDDDDGLIYDEQQQEFMIESLRQEANTFNRKVLIFLRIFVGLSCIIQLLFNNLPNNPIFSQKESILSTPLRVIFSASSFLIHYFLAFILSISYPFLYSISVLAPTISLLFKIPWKVAIWWSYTPLVVFAVLTVTNRIENIDRGIAKLEGLKYKAPGA